MIEEPVRRRRRRRRRAGGTAATPAAAPPLRGPGLPQWLTFPVACAFVAGILIMGVVAYTPLAFPVFVIGLFGLGLCLSHVALRWWIARRRR